VKREEIVRLGKQLDDSSTHIQIFCVPVFRSLDAFELGLNVRGHTRRRNIIIEDIGTLLELRARSGSTRTIRTKSSRIIVYGHANANRLQFGWP
jgi:hypothetical protein